MRRVFVVSTCVYPHGDALSNYLDSFCKCLLDCGYDVNLVCNLNKGEKYTKHKGINVIFINKPQEFILETEKVLKDTSEDDMVFQFCTNIKLAIKLLSLRKKHHFKLGAGVLEMFSKEDVGTIGYIYENYYKKHQLKKYDLIISISDFIDKYYKKNNIKTCLLPPMVEYSGINIKKNNNSKINFILPVSRVIKDSFDEIMDSFLELSDSYDNFSLNITGLKKETLEEKYSVDKMKRMNKFLILHDWLDYDSLLSLYKKSDYLILARKEKQTTIANFPSKVPEVMNCGVVPIVSNVGDYTKYYLEDGINSIFIKDSILEALSVTLSMDYNNYIKLSKNALICVKNKFDYHVYSKKVKMDIEDLF